jgi:AI-2 transport protein TqsA
MTDQRPHWAAVILIAVLASIAALSMASTVVAPVAFALLIIALVWPLQKALQAAMPRMLALFICIVAMVFVSIAFGWLIAWGFGRVGRWILSEGPRFQLLYDQTTQWLEGHGVVVAGLWAEHFNVGWLLRAVQSVTGRVNSAMSFWIVVFVYVILGLLEVEDFGSRARNISNPDIRRVLVTGTIETARKIRRYMFVRTQMSMLTGLLVWMLAKLFGLELAAEWGVIAFTLNYVPFIGPLIATVFPTALALVQFESWQTAVLIFASLNIVQFVVGSYIEPRVSGNALSISPFIVLFSVFFWTYIWGLFGAVIGVPVMIAVLTFCAQHPSSRWLAELLSSAGKAEAIPAQG